MENKNKFEMNETQLESVSGGVDPDAIRVTDISFVTEPPCDNQEENVFHGSVLGPWSGWYYQPCTNCGEITVFKDTLEESGNKIKVLRCIQCGHVEYV